MKFFTVATLFAASAAAAYTPCGKSVGKPANAKCCGVNPIRGASLLCQDPARKPSTLAEYKTICGKEQPKCCAIDVLGLLDVNCQDPAKEAAPPAYNPCTNPDADAPRCCRRSLSGSVFCEDNAPSPPPKDLASFQAQCMAAKPESERAYCCKTLSDGTVSDAACLPAK